MRDDADELVDRLERCAAGDTGALREIYDRESGRMVAVARRILRRRDLAEEAVQDSFLRIWQKASQFDAASGSAHGWVYAILRNRALSILRDATRELPTEQTEIDRLEGDVVAGAEAAFDALGDRSRLRNCLDRLDDTKRRCVLLAHCYGYTHGEIAGRLGAPLGTVKAWVRRGLASLRACLQ